MINKRKRLFLVVALCFLCSLMLGGTITRSTKTNSGSGTTYENGKPLDATELDAEAVTIFNAINGSLDNTNLSGSAGITSANILDGTLLDADVNAAALIAYSKFLQTAAQQDMDIVDDYSANEAEQEISTTPGTSVAPATFPLDLESELEMIRYTIERLAIGTTATVIELGGGSDTDAYWIDGPYRPGNMIANGGFDVWTSAADAAADGWVLVQTPTLAAADLTESEGQGDGQGLLTTGNGATLEGVSQLIGALKADTSYLARAAVRPTTGDSCRMTATGTDGTDLSVTSVSTNAFEIISGIFETDSTPADVTLNLLSVADGDVCLWDQVAVWEIATDPVPQPSGFGITDTYAGTHSFTTSFAAVTDIASQTLTPPGPGYMILVMANLSIAETSAGADNMVMRITEDCASAGAVSVAEIELLASSATGSAQTASLHYLDPNPAPGADCVYALEGKEFSGTWAVRTTDGGFVMFSSILLSK